MKIGLRTIKTAIGAALAIIIAQSLGLDNSLSAGIITILSVQNTKQKSIVLAKQRAGSTFLALTLGTILFSLLGYHAVVFGLFLLLFIPLTVKFKLTDGIVMSSVIVTHLLAAQSAHFELLLNETLLVIIGAGIGIILNLYMPSLEDEIKETQQHVEMQMKQIFMQLARTISSQSVTVSEERLYQELYETLQHGYEKAAHNHENQSNEERLYYVEYMEMRLRQYQLLQNMRQALGRVGMSPEQAKQLTELTQFIADNLHEHHNATAFIMKTEDLLTHLRAQDLPLTRLEFESRAMLFQYLNELMSLLEVKQTFRQQLTVQQLEKFGCCSV